MNNRKMPLWNKNPLERLGSPSLDTWLPFTPVLVGILCCLLYYGQVFSWMIVGPSSTTPIEFTIVLNGLFVLLIIFLLTTKYLFACTRNPLCPLPVGIAGNNAGYAWGRQDDLNHQTGTRLTANEEPLNRVSKFSRMTTTPKQTEADLAGSSEKDTSSPRKKEDLNQTLAIVNQIGQTLTTSLHLADIATICRIVLDDPQLKELFSFDVAEICLWDDQTSTLTTALRLPENNADIQAYDRTYQLDEGYTGWLATHQKPLLIDDTRQHTEATPKIGGDSFPYHSFVGVPLKVGLKLLGTLELAAEPVDVYNQQDVTLLEIVANQVSIAIDHARLFDETQRKVSELSVLFDASRELSSTLSYDELLNNLSRQMIKAFPADDCAIFEFDEATGTLKLVHQCSNSTASSTEAPLDFSKEMFTRTITKIPAWETSFKSHTPLIIRLNGSANSEEVELLKQCNCGSIVAIPLVSRDKVTGLLVLFAVDPQAFTDDQIPLAQSLANQANIAMENAHLFGLTDQRLQKRIDELAGLQRVSSELNSTLDLDKILDLVLAEALRVTRANLGHVNVYNIESGKLVAHKKQTGAGHPQPEDETSAKDSSDVPDQRMMERVLHSGEATLIPDVRQDKDYIGFGDDTRSRVVVPIYYAGEPAGVINLESNRLDFFTENQVRYLESLANQAAVAIGNAQAYEEQKREREQASRRIDQLSQLAEISNIFRTNRPLYEVLEDIAYAIIESVGYHVVLINLVLDDPPALYHEVGAGIPIPEFEEFRNSANAQPLANLQSIMLDEFRLGKSYFIPLERKEVWQDELDISYLATQPAFDSGASKAESNNNIWRTGDVLFVPLTDTDDNIIGLLTVEDPDTGERPNVSSIQTLETFANHAATAIENARLLELEQQRRRLADTLRGVAEAISSQLEFDELLNIVLGELANVVNYDSASVQRLEEDRLVIIGGRAWEYSQQVVGLSFSMMGINPHRVVIETQEPVIIKDARDEYPAAFSSPPYDRIRSWLGLPLTYGANILGLMSLGSIQADFFTQEDVEVALAFANQVAVAMQNARLFEEARQQVRQLAALTEVAQSLNRTLNLNEVLNLVLDAVFDLVGRSLGSVWLVDNYSSTIKIANTKNISDFLVELFNESAISVDSEPFVSVINSGEVLVVEKSINTEDNVANYSLPAFPDDVTYVPLKTEQGVIGILAIETVIHNKNMLQLVTTLADLAAIAIDNTRLLEDTRQRANEMQNLYNLGVEVSGMLEVQQVMGSVVENAITLTDTQLGVILFWDEEVQHYLVEGTASSEELLSKLTFGKVQEPGEPASGETEDSGPKSDDLPLWYDLTQQIVDGSRPININLSERPNGQPDPNQTAETETQPDISIKHAQKLGIQAMLGLPIKVQNQTNGAIFIGSLVPRNFDNYDIQLLSFVANQASVAVRNAQLVQRLNLFTEELEQRVAQRTEELARTLADLTIERDRVEALYQITRELSASLDLDRILTQALSLINRAVGISHGSILLLDQESGKLMYRAALGRDKPLPEKVKEAENELDYILAEKVVETRQSQVIPDLSESPDELIGEGPFVRHSAVAVPLVTGDEVAGVLLLFHPEVNYFSEDHLKLVSAAATQVATAINNAELYRLITDQADRLGVMLRSQAAEAAKNEAILLGITDGVVVLDADYNITLLNPKAAEILEIDPTTAENQPLQQILGQSASSEALELTQLFHDNFLKSLERIEAGRPSAEFRIEAGNKAVVVTLGAVALGSEELPSIVTVLRDISQEAEVERLKNEFISTVSHELRTPLTSIKGYADLLVSASTHVGELSPTQKRFIEVIRSNTNRLANLVNDILEISRIETGRIKLELESLDIISTIKEVAVSFEGQLVQKPMNFSLDLPDSPPTVYADKARVVQILVNLIGNAWRYTHEGGGIIVRAKVRDDEFVQIDVEDSGIGIVEQDLEYIFDRFYRSERGEVEMVDGTGLGLSITKNFVEMFGGEIWVESEKDVGSTFSFILPVQATVAEDTLVDLADRSQVLLIDDDAAVIDVLKPRLEKMGYKVITTDKGAEVLEIARKSNQNLRLIVLDLLLEEVDSFEILAQLKLEEATANIPVVTTALRVAPNGEDLSLEVADYIATSFDESQILETVGLALNKTKVPLTDDDQEALRSKKYIEDHILIIDDNPDMARWLKNALDDCGCYVQRAFNSRQALDMAASNPDLILADGKMSGVDGETIVAQLRHTPETKDIPIIIITDSPVPPKDSATVRMLRLNSQTGTRQSASVGDLVTEMMQVNQPAEDETGE